MSREHEIFCRAFQQLILQSRQEQFITQKKLSLESGLTRQFISMMESGKRMPSFENFCSLAKGLGVSITDLSEKFVRLYHYQKGIMEQRLAEMDSSGSYDASAE